MLANSFLIAVVFSVYTWAVLSTLDLKSILGEVLNGT